jgi:hypothetical protein
MQEPEPPFIPSSDLKLVFLGVNRQNSTSSLPALDEFIVAIFIGNFDQLPVDSGLLDIPVSGYTRGLDRRRSLTEAL